MAQHDYDIANQTFPSFRSDLNSVLEAINTSNSGTSRPSSAVAGTIWLDTTNATNPTLKLYDGADDISLATFDYSANTVNWIDSTVVFDIVNDTTPELGGDLSVNGNSIVSTSNGNITFTPDGTGKVVISGLSFPTADGTSGQAIVTDGCGNLSFASVEGRTGTVNWDTTAKTTNFTAVNGNGYFVDTSSGAITVTLPATPSGGDIISLKDYSQTFTTNNVTLARNGSNIEGVATDLILDGSAESVTFVYVDSTKGWLLVGESLTKYGASFISATGGTVTCCGDYKIHTFTSPGTFTVCSVGNPAGSSTVDYLVIAGGGGAGNSAPSSNAGGGGGAGGYREGYNPGSYIASPLATTALPVTATSYPITVGAGGNGASPSTTVSSGSSSIFSTITSAGGGNGANRSPSSPYVNAGSGGSGGGGAGGLGVPSIPSTGCGASGNTPPVSPPQGNDGGDNQAIGSGGGTDNPAGGGGGATAVGQDGQLPASGGNGGAGATSSINGTPTARAGGGAGGGNPPGAGGTGGGGGGGVSGTVNTGGGGGGTMNGGAGGNGGSGIVIIRYKYQ